METVSVGKHRFCFKGNMTSPHTSIPSSIARLSNRGVHIARILLENQTFVKFHTKFHYFTVISAQANDTNEISLSTTQIAYLADILTPLLTFSLEIVNSEVIMATEVLLKPRKNTDWEIISSHASSVENDFLRQFSILYRNQVLRIRVSTSMVADVIVQKISTSSMKSMDEYDVARLSTSTKLIVEPFVSPAVIRPSEDYQMSISKKSLRVIPDRFFDKVTSACPHHIPSKNVIDKDEILNLLDMDDGDERDVRTSEDCDAVACVHPEDWIQCSSLALVNLSFSRAPASGTVKALTTHTLVMIKVSEGVRRGHVRLPWTVRAVIQARDYCRVDLLPIDSSKLPLRYPQRIFLQPMVIEANSASLSQQTDCNGLLMRFRESHRRHGHGFALVDKSILHLPSTSEYFYVRVLYSVDVDQDEEAEAQDGRHDIVVPNVVFLDRDEDFCRCCDPAVLRIVSSPLVYTCLDTFKESHSEVKEVPTPVQGMGLLSSSIYPLLEEIFAMFLPVAAAERRRLNIHPVTGALVECGCLETRQLLMRTIRSFLSSYYSLALNITYLDCSEVSKVSIQMVVARLTETFEEARARAPTIVILDNLDHICPWNGEEAEFGVSHFNRTSLISLHLERLLSEAHSQNLSYAIKGLEAEELVYTLASVTSTEIFPYLRSFQRLRRVFPVHRMNALNRLEALKIYLNHYSSSQPALSWTDDREMFQHFSRMTEGYTLRDIHQLARQITATSRDIDFDLESFKPLSSNFSSSSHREATTVGGLARAKQELAEILLYPVLFRRLYRSCPVKMPRGVLLYGPSGCGKTLLAQSIAAEFQLSMIAVKGPQLLNKYIGASEKAVRELFISAAESGRPTILFFDEFEALAPRRGKDSTGVTDRVVNQLLTFLDGVESFGTSLNTSIYDEYDENIDHSQIFVVAATSRPDLIDPALLRPGRIERHIFLDIPRDSLERKDILNALLKNICVDDSVSESVDRIVENEKVSLRFTGADLKALVNAAYLEAARDAIEASDVSNAVITSKHLMKALDLTQPSTSIADMDFCQRIYSRFQKSASSETDGSLMENIKIQKVTLK